jgi:hypothetical protein
MLATFLCHLIFVYLFTLLMFVAAVQLSSTPCCLLLVWSNYSCHYFVYWHRELIYVWFYHSATKIVFIMRVKNLQACFQNFMTNYMTIEGMFICFYLRVSDRWGNRISWTTTAKHSPSSVIRNFGNAVFIGCSFTGMLVFGQFWTICSPVLRCD